MSANRSRRLDRRTAEQILSGAPAVRDHELNALLAAAAAPAREREQGGEDAAVAAFRSAHANPLRRSRRRPLIRTTLAAAAAVAVGGVATVAATGKLPVALGSHPAPAPARSSAASTTATEPSPTRPAGAGRDPGNNTGGRTGPSASPSPSLVGLCHAYTAGAGAEHGKALDSPAFTALITTAGGEDAVGAYCATLLAGVPGEPGDAPDGRGKEPPHRGSTAHPRSGHQQS